MNDPSRMSAGWAMLLMPSIPNAMEMPTAMAA